jgi:hypothetical protein
VNEQRLTWEGVSYLKERVMLRAEQFRQDTAKFWFDLDQKRKVLTTEVKAKPTTRRKLTKAVPRPGQSEPEKKK